jgi:uncharacterized protein (DUF58 family)
MIDRDTGAPANGTASGAGPHLPMAGVDPAILAEVETLQLNARDVAHGALAGMHRSRRRGTAIEFSEHKLYAPGDDIRHIDWRAFAKTDRYHVKQFEDETNLSVELIVDHSGSMGFASETRPTKLEYARTLAAALGYLALRQGDAAGLTTYSTEVSGELPARATSAHLMELLQKLTRLAPAGETGTARCVDQFAQRTRRRSVTIMLSDLFDPDPNLMVTFRRLAARRHDVAVLHLLDPFELSFPYENPSFFLSMEDERKLFVHPRTLRQTFIAEMQKFLKEIARRMAEAGIDYHLVNTALPPAQVLGGFLRGRERRG